MRIGIREQLGLLVLLTTLIALAVVAVATVFYFYPVKPLLAGCVLMTLAPVGEQL